MFSEVCLGSRNAAGNRSNSKSNSGSKAGSRGARVQQDNTVVERSPFLKNGMHDELIGIVLTLVGVVLFIAVIIPGDALLSSAIASALRHAFGIGAFLLPLAFVIWGVSHFVLAERMSTARFITGISLIVVAVMGLFSLFHVGVLDSDPMTLFSDDVLVNGGGYVGSGLSWALMTLFGRIIACVIFVALIVAGLVLTGLSISTPFLFIKNFIAAGREERAQRRDHDGFEEGAQLYYQEDLDDASDPAYLPESDETIVLGNRKRKRLTNKAKAQDVVETLKLGAQGADGPAPEGEFDPDYTPFATDEDLTATVMLDEEQDASEAKTVALDPQKKKRGSKTTRRSQKRKDAERDQAASAADEIAKAAAGPTALEGFELPPKGVLRVGGGKRSSARTGELKETAAQLQQTLEEFSLPARVVGWLAGPTVTMFKVQLPKGVKLAKLVSLADDIALALAAEAVRIAQIPGTSLVGVEIPNKTRSTVLFGDILGACKPGPLQVAVGEDVDGEKICADLAKMPHLLIAGTTGSGKSVCLNGMIMTMLMRATPAEVRMIMIDPKRVEFSVYNGIPHLYVPPVTEPKEAASALRWAVAEMERRLKVFEGVGARNIGKYNKLIQDGELTDEDGNHPDEMPYIVVVIDELSDLMMVAGKEVEDSIVRISQLARAAGIHLIVATQRPTSNVVTGMIKANITNRIALSVATGIESRVIMDQPGAEKLVGNGDMLYTKPEWGKPKRIQGCFVDDAEIASVVEHLKAQGSPEYHTEILQLQVGGGSGSGGGGNAASAGDSDDDPLIWEAADAVVHAGLGSTSMLQRRLKVGYARAGRIMDMLEAKGIVGPPDGSRAREVLIDSVEDLEAIKAFEAQDREGM